MGTEAFWLAAVSAAVGVATSVDASNKQKAAARDAKDAQAIQRNQQAAQDAIQRRAAIREERIRRAQILQNAANSGAAGSSGSANAISNLSGKVGASLSNISFGSQTADQVTALNNKIQGNLDNAQASLTMGRTLTGLIDAGASAYAKATTNPDGTPKVKLNESEQKL